MAIIIYKIILKKRFSKRYNLIKRTIKLLYATHDYYCVNKCLLFTESFKPTPHKYDYKEYKPSHVGMYGDKPRVKKPKINAENHVTAPKPKRPTRTFESYSGARGPDMKTVDYKPAKYVPNSNPYKPGTPFKPMNYNGNDPLKHRSVDMSKGKGTDKTKRPSTYRLDENNYTGKNNWNFGFVTDPLPWKE